MRKTTAAGIVLILLLLGAGRVSAGNTTRGNVFVLCPQVKLVGTWDKFTGFHTKIEGNCSAFLVNPFNVSVRYNHTAWFDLNVYPNAHSSVDVGYLRLDFPRVWIKPGETLKGNVSIQGRIFGINGLFEVLRAGNIKMTGVGTVAMITKKGNNTSSVFMEFKLRMSPKAAVDWKTVAPVASVILFPFIWFAIGILLSVLNRKREDRTWGWGLFTSYSVIWGVLGQIVTAPSPRTQLIAVVSLESLILTLWVSITNRATPEKPEGTTQFMGNAVLFFLGLSILMAFAGGYLEGNSEVTGGILFLTVIFGVLSYYVTDKSIREEEDKGKIPRIYTLPLGIALLFFAYPVAVVFWLIGWDTGLEALLAITVLFFATGMWIVRKAKRGTKLQSV